MKVALWSLIEAGIGIVPESRKAKSSGMIIGSRSACCRVLVCIVFCKELVVRTLTRMWKFWLNRSSFRSPMIIMLFEKSYAFSMLRLRLLKKVESAVLGL